MKSKIILIAIITLTALRATADDQTLPAKTDTEPSISDTIRASIERFSKQNEKDGVTVNEDAPKKKDMLEEAGIFIKKPEESSPKTEAAMTQKSEVNQTLKIEETAQGITDSSLKVAVPEKTTLPPTSTTSAVSVRPMTTTTTTQASTSESTMAKPAEEAQLKTPSTGESPSSTTSVGGSTKTDKSTASVKSTETVNTETTIATGREIKTSTVTEIDETNSNSEAPAKPMMPETSLEIGENKHPVEPKIQRIDLDQPLTQEDIKNMDREAAKKFVIGGEVMDKAADREVVRYVYVSRGGWLIKAFQGYIDRLRVPVAREDRRDLTDAYLEVQRSFAFLCLLIATDDGGDKSKMAISEAVSSHRETISRLKLVLGTSSNKDFAALLKEYIDATYFTNLDKDLIRIPAGSLSSARYKSYESNFVSPGVNP
jgi:hypothetical protein